MLACSHAIIRQLPVACAVALGENEALHFGIPTTGLVPEVNAAIE